MTGSFNRQWSVSLYMILEEIAKKKKGNQRSFTDGAGR